MRIPNDLVSFVGKKVLLIVTSPAYAEFYRGSENNIVKAESFRIAKPELGDPKSHLSNTSMSGRQKIGTSGLEQLTKRDMLQRFDKRFKEYIKKLALKDNFDELYIFCPSYFETEVERLLPANLRKKIVQVIKGNFHKIHIILLLQKLTKKKRVEVIKK